MLSDDAMALEERLDLQRLNLLRPLLATLPRDAQLTLLLDELAETLNHLNLLDVSVSAKNGIIITDVGYVLPDHTGSWSARRLVTMDDEFQARNTHLDDD